MNEVTIVLIGMLAGIMIGGLCTGIIIGVPVGVGIAKIWNRLHEEKEASK